MVSLIQHLPNGSGTFPFRVILICQKVSVSHAERTKEAVTKRAVRERRCKLQNSYVYKCATQNAICKKLPTSHTNSFDIVLTLFEDYTLYRTTKKYCHLSKLPTQNKWRLKSRDVRGLQHSNHGLWQR